MGCLWDRFQGFGAYEQVQDKTGQLVNEYILGSTVNDSSRENMYDYK